MWRVVSELRESVKGPRVHAENNDGSSFRLPPSSNPEK